MTNKIQLQEQNQVQAQTSKQAILTNFKKNIMGTVSFDAQFNGMRKAQEFIVYPINGEDTPAYLTIQSDTRFGRIDLVAGVVMMSKSKSSGSYSMDLAIQGYPVIDTLSIEKLNHLKTSVINTANKNAGTNGIVFCDNQGAANLVLQA